MYLTIWRHGQAGTATSDRERCLTDQGVDDIGFGCMEFHSHCETLGLPHPELILYSEWERTRQTADIIASAFTHAACEPCPALIPGSPVSGVDSELDRRLADPPAHLLLVSHQPLVSALADHYLGERGRVPGLVPGGLLSVELEAAGFGCASLVFCAQPPEYAQWR